MSKKSKLDAAIGDMPTKQRLALEQLKAERFKSIADKLLSLGNWTLFCLFSVLFINSIKNSHVIWLELVCAIAILGCILLYDYANIIVELLDNAWWWVSTLRLEIENDLLSKKIKELKERQKQLLQDIASYSSNTDLNNQN